MTPSTRRAPPAVVVVLMMGLIATGCAAGGGTYGADDPAGFFSGIWHGWIAPFALIVHIFDRGVRIYEPNNTGIWYDVGFYIAVISGFGSVSFRRTTSKQRAREQRRMSGGGRSDRA